MAIMPQGQKDRDWKKSREIERASNGLAISTAEDHLDKYLKQQREFKPGEYTKSEFAAVNERKQAIEQLLFELYEHIGQYKTIHGLEMESINRIKAAEKDGAQ